MGAAGERERRIAVWVPTFAAVAPVLAQSDLVATLPAVVMQGAVERGEILRLSPPAPIAPMPHRMVWSRKLDADPAVRWIRDRLAAALRAALDGSSPPRRARR
jgi:DNA-binding transcriptional LysR family regulator